MHANCVSDLIYSVGKQHAEMQWQATADINTTPTVKVKTSILSNIIYSLLTNKIKSKLK